MAGFIRTSTGAAVAVDAIAAVFGLVDENTQQAFTRIYLTKEIWVDDMEFTVDDVVKLAGRA